MNFMKDFKHDTHSKNATRSHIINNVEKLDWNDILKTIEFVPMNIIYDKVKTHSLNVCSYAVLCPFRSNREVSLGVYIDIIGCSLEPNGGMHYILHIAHQPLLTDVLSLFWQQDCDLAPFCPGTCPTQSL